MGVGWVSCSSSLLLAPASCFCIFLAVLFRSTAADISRSIRLEPIDEGVPAPEVAWLLVRVLRRRPLSAGVLTATTGGILGDFLGAVSRAEDVPLFSNTSSSSIPSWKTCFISGTGMEATPIAGMGPRFLLSSGVEAMLFIFSSPPTVFFMLNWNPSGANDRVDALEATLPVEECEECPLLAVDRRKLSAGGSTIILGGLAAATLLVETAVLDKSSSFLPAPADAEGAAPAGRLATLPPATAVARVALAPARVVRLVVAVLAAGPVALVGAVLGGPLAGVLGLRPTATDLLKVTAVELLLLDMLAPGAFSLGPGPHPNGARGWCTTPTLKAGLFCLFFISSSFFFSSLYFFNFSSILALASSTLSFGSAGCLAAALELSSTRLFSVLCKFSWSSKSSSNVCSFLLMPLFPR